MSCPATRRRAGMTDEEFWEDVGNSIQGTADGAELVEVYPEFVLDTTCPLCGAYGACAWDANGRPLIHATEYPEPEKDGI